MVTELYCPWSLSIIVKPVHLHCCVAISWEGSEEKVPRTRSKEPAPCSPLGPICCTLVLFPGLNINYHPHFRQHSKVFLGLAQSVVVVLSS